MRVLAYPHNFIIIITKMYIHIFFSFHDVNIKKNHSPLTHNKKSRDLVPAASGWQRLIIQTIVIDTYHLTRLSIHFDFNIDVTFLVSQAPYSRSPFTV